MDGTRIQRRIEALSAEAEALMNERMEIYGRVEDIDVKLHQIAGSIQELMNLLKDEAPTE
jgi:peptidoglycan hydrolase CwlO-like protein